MMTDRLFYGDNLDVLRRHIPDESVDLIYLDPPFQSGRDYNVLFQEQDGKKAAAQIKAFEDTWEWLEPARLCSKGGMKKMINYRSSLALEINKHSISAMLTQRRVLKRRPTIRRREQH